MPLIPCPVCERQISSEAEACPQCGHPNKPARPQPAAHTPPPGPKCYSCSRSATTRCQSCGAMSCAEHLQSIHVGGQGGNYELRCASCYDSAMTWKIVGWVVGGIGIIIILSSWANMSSGPSFP